MRSYNHIMSGPSPLTSDPPHCPTAREIGAVPDAREGAPPLAPDVVVAPQGPPPDIWRDDVSPPDDRPNAPPAAAPVEDEETTSDWQDLKLLIVTFISQMVTWCREEGFWYLTSMTVHAVGLFALAMISLAIPRAIFQQDQAPTFDAPKVEQASPVDITRFEVGEPQLDPSELDPASMTDFKALPMGAPEEKFYDDSPEFEEAGGGTRMDVKGPKLGGLGGFSIKDLPGPGGRGGVGVGVGTGNNAGSGGAGEGLGGRGRGHLKKGATKVTERAVFAALNWLARHQTPQGKWSIDFKHQCKGGVCSGAGFVQSDAAATAMGLLPFLAAGQTHKSKGLYQQNIAKGLIWLVKQQRSSGDLAGGCAQPMYAHGLATIALCEAYGMTRDEHLGAAARRAVQYIELAQNESTGGWRYEPGDPGDTSVFGWQIMALKSAQLAGLPVNSIVFDRGQRWLHSVAKGEHLGLYSYQPYQQITPTLTAVGMLCRQYMGIDPKDAGLLEGKRSLMENLPDNNLARNTYYWYYATLVMHNFQDADWDTWNRKMRRALVETQVREGCATGSWDPDKPTADAWGRNGGRLMTTSFSALILEVYYRFMPLFKTDSYVPQPSNPMGLGEPPGAKADK
jgi:hypothetical protein